MEQERAKTKRAKISKGKLIAYLLFTVTILTSLIIGIFMGDTLDMQVEASTLWLACIGIGWFPEIW